MFWLHDKTRRALCSRIFFWLAFVPTLAVCAWIVWIRSDLSRKACEDALAQHLGVVTTLSAVSFPLPGMAEYQGLAFADTEGSQPFASIHSARITTSGQKLQLTISRARVRSDRLPRFWKSLASATKHDVTEVELSIAELQIDGDAPLTLKNLRGQLKNIDDQAHFKLSYESTDSGPSRAGELLVTEQSAAEPTLRVELRSNYIPIPCEHLASFWPTLRRLGDEARFLGTVKMEESASGWHANVGRSRIDNVNLGVLAAEATPYCIASTASLDLHGARVVDGRLKTAQGELLAGPGLIDKRMLLAAAKELGLKHLPDLAAKQTGELALTLRFNHLALAFYLDEKGILLLGRCDPKQPGVVLAGADRRHLAVLRIEKEPVPFGSVLRTLLPDDASTLPASRQASALAKWLPLPDAPRVSASDSRTAAKDRPASAKTN
jgi:hypothetical protein